MKRVFIDESSIIRKPSDNLVINEYCSKLISKGVYDFIARVYAHNKGVILGANESLLDVNLSSCEELGYEVVRRPSGGSLIITEPELTLCYSIFFKSKKFGFEETYKSIVIPLAKSLGDDFSVTGYYYLRYGGKPLAGHAIKNRGAVTQFDGVINLESFNVELIKNLFHTRNYYEGGVILMNGQTHDLRGRIIQADITNSKLIRSEEEELGNVIGLNETGLTKELFINKLHELFNEPIGLINYPETEINHYKELINARLNKGRRACLGHCFIDLIEPEPIIHY